MSEHFDVAIIGGGLSGLATAVGLAQHGANIVLLEQAPKLGGRCYSYVDNTTGDVVDNGQHLLVGAYHHTLRYLDIIGTRPHLRAEKKLRLPLHHPDKGFASFEVSPLPRPLHLTAGMLKFKLLTLNERRQLLNVGVALQKLHPAAEEQLARTSVDEWLTLLRQSGNAKNCLWYPLAISVMNEVPHKASALLFARSLRSTFLGTTSDARILVPTIGQTELYVDPALNHFSRHRVSVRTNTQVTSVLLDGKRAAGVELNGGKRILCGCVVSAVPYYAVAGMLPPAFRNEAPFAHLRQFQSSPIVSLHLWFDKEFMTMDYVGLIGKNNQWLFNRRRIVSAAGTPTSYLTSVISGAHTHVEWTKQRLVTCAVQEIREIFPEAEGARLLHALVVKEKRATFSPTNEIEPLRPSAQTDVGNFFLAGDWTATGLPATIEGAIMSGFTAARHVLERLE